MKKKIIFRLAREREKGEKSRLTSVEKVRVRLRTAAYELLKYYVYLQGIKTSEVCQKSKKYCILHII